MQKNDTLKVVLRRVLIYPETAVRNGLPCEREILKNICITVGSDDNAAKILSNAALEFSSNRHLLLVRKNKQVFVFAKGRGCCYHLLKTPLPVKDYKVNAGGLLLCLYDKQNKISLYYFDTEWKLSLLREGYATASIDAQDVVRVQNDDDVVKSKRTLLQYDRFMRRFIIKGTERL